MTYERIEQAEPAILTGLVTSLAGFFALLAADFSVLHGAAVAFGSASTQALLTRPTVYSPKSIQALESGEEPYDRLLELLRTDTHFAHPHEPAATIGVLTLMGGFLVQVFTGVDFLSAFASAAGISGVQTLATRQRVSSPVGARGALARGLFVNASAAGGEAAPTGGYGPLGRRG
jgi:hypothetical protein